MDEDSPWLCTQVVVVNDDRPDDGEEKSNDFGCIVLSDMNDNECYVLQEGDNTIGRHPLNNIFIEHPSVSMNHAVIQCDSDGVVLSDKGSLNKTRLNKKILKKAVAYFLDENALLMFGEVRAKYFVDSNSYNTTNESKSNESNDNTVEKKIGNDDTPLLKLTNTVVISDSSTGHNTNCSTSLVNKNNSINEKISEVNTKQKNINGHIDNICSVSNSSNSSDAFLLDAVSQIEEITDLTEQTPVKTYGNSTDETLNNSLREDTPSPVMDLGISLSNQFSTMSKVSTDESQSLKCMNEGNEREDTPSPVMDLGIFSYSDNKMYTPATNNYDIHSTNESTKKIDGLDETQILEVKEHPSSLINQFDTNEPNLLNECTQLPIMDDKCLPNTQTQKAQCLSINVEGRSSLLDMQSNKNKCDETSMETQHFKLNDNDFFDRPTQKCSTSNSSVSFNQSINQTDNEIKKKLDIFEEDDDDIFLCLDDKAEFNDRSKIMKINLSKTNLEKTTDTKQVTSNSNNINLPEGKFNRINEVHSDDFFDCPTQKLSTSKHSHCTIKDDVPKQNVIEKKINTFEADDDDIFSSFIQEESKSQSYISTSLKDDDFYNCPTQKLSIDKHFNITTEKSSTKHQKSIQQFLKPGVSSINTSKIHTSSIHEEETQKFHKHSQPVVSDLSNSKNFTSPINNDITQIPEMDDDFFNRPTQKLSITKKKNSKVNPTIHEEETQKLKECSQPIVLKTTNDKACTSSLHDDLTQVPEMDDDFFNCPTQKMSIIKKINSKASSTIHEEETQELPKLGVPVTSISRNCTSRINNDLNQVPEMDDDFFNCPTQKYSNIKKINSKVNSTINEEETQKLEDFPKLIVPNTTNAKTCTSSTDNDLTQAPEMDDDFFNCPTQKYSNMKTTGSKVNSTIHEEETQKLEEFRQPVVLNTKTTFRTSKSNIHDDLTQIPEPDDEDFFNCATQKVSIIKKLDSKVSSTINEEETQKLPDFSKTNVSNTRITGTDVTRMNDLTREPVIEDDFFNCPTQKISNVWKTNLKVNSSIKETQNIPKHGYQSISTLKTGTTSTSKSPTNVPELDDEDFFNQPTQKLASDVKPSSDLKKNKTIVSNINEAQTQKLPNQSEPNISTSSKSVLTNHCEKIYPIFDNNDGRKSLRQKRTVVSSNTDDSKIRKSLRIDSQKNSKLSEKPPVICKQNQNSSKSPKTSKKPLIQVRKDLCAPIPKSECLNNKSPSNTNKSVSNSMLNNTQSVNKPINSPRRSKIIENNLSRLSVKQEPLNNDSPNNTESVNKPINSPRRSKIIENNLSRVSVKREPLNNDSPNNTQSVNKRINSPRRSKIIENNLSRVSVKREPLNNDSTGQVLNNTLLKLQSEQFNETAVFSPLNIPNLSANSSLEQYLTSTPDVDSSSSSSKQSSSSSVASKWQSFWNKKKMACQNKGSTDGTKKERYQTRANTKKENIPECSRKRKQGDSIDFDESNKRLCDRVKKRMSNPLNESTSETVVTFSYLRNRHLQEMKQFIERTRGFVTDDVTQCTVLVTDKIRCTMKTLSAIARGCPIVDANWVKHSYTVQMFQDVDEFILADKDTERKYKFRLKESLARARAKKLLDGYTVLVTPSVKPGPKEMKVIITCAGGDYVMNWPKTRVQKGLIVTCDQDCRRWKSMWDNDAAKKIDCDTLVMSIVRQKLNLDS